MSLKALAHNVLDRNPQRNRSATTLKKGCNFRAISNPKKGQKLRPIKDWGDEILTIAVWLQKTPPPAKPFELHPGVSVVDPTGFWQAIKYDVAAGKNGPRTYYGALQKDLRRLAVLFGGRVQ